MVLVMRRVDSAQLSLLRANPDRVLEFAVEDEAAQKAGDIIDFDKAWHALHFVLTGTADEIDAPLSLRRRDHELLGEDFGYGPSQVVSPANMGEFNDALAKLSDDDLHRRYDPAALGRADVYFGDVFAEEGEEMWDYIGQALPGLRKFAAACAATASGAIVSLC